MNWETRFRAAALAGVVWLGSPAFSLAHDGPLKHWLESLQRPDNDRNPHRQLDPKGLFCCGLADIVKTKFRVESAGGPYPEDRWYAWLKDKWEPIPPEKILKEYAPDGQAYMFMLADTIQCFVRPNGGL